MGTPVINENSHVWVEDQTFAWIDGKVLKINGREAEIETRNGMVVANLSKLYPKDTELPDGGVDDMANLSYLHEPGVLQNLAARYTLEKIYTYTGNTLIAINPFQSLSYLYNADMMEKYKGVSLGELSPHVFSIADAAYRAMVNEGKSNSILVSGESGAGKTETTKMLMRYLVYLGGHAAVEGQTVEQQVLESNPVLEAFGNAKTVRNNNSSRFGKFVEIQFDTCGRISGAAIRTYLLERSRVCQISDPERNYHCFYRLCAAPQKDVEKYKLGNPRSFHYLNQSNCHELADVNESHEYQATKRAMDIVGVSEHEQDAIFRVVAAILHLGNIDFSCGEEIDSSVLKDGNSRFHLEMTAELLMCDPHALEDALCKRVMITREEVIKRSLDPVGAMVSRDGLAKTIYSRLFEWLVDKINVSIGQDLNSKSCIGVLDIYGFESFKTNSFEQFCINFTNEKLQHYFNEHVFKMEQDEYSKEGIDWSYIEFVDNQDVLDLIEKKPGGIFALLDEACMFPKSSHESFSQKLYQMYKDHKRFIKPKLARTDFIIAHYAGQVHYQSDQFLDKNKDYVSLEHQGLLSSSRCCFISGLFPLVPEETTKFTKFSSIGSRFKLQLQQLMDTLNSMDPHFVRCVKPNCLLKPAFFDNVEVVQQLRSGGVLEAIRISCAGYPTRKTFHEFLRRFGIVVPAVLEGNFDEELACKRILEMTGMVEFQMGKSKVFLKDGPMAELDARKGEISSNSVKAIQGRFRTYITRKKYIVLLKAAIYVQSFWRGRLAFKSYQCIKREAAAIMIQKRTRGHLVRGAYTKLKFSVLVLQTGLQAMVARMALRYRREAKATLTIQACWRCHRFCSHFRKLRWASIISQCRRRGVIATRELRKLKVAANEVVSLKQSKYEFEKQVEELSWKLELEKRLKSDLEEAKDEEITNLQHALQVMLKKVDETYEIFVSKQEAAQTSAVKPIHVFTDDSIAHNTILMETLATEVDKLMSIQELSLSEKQRTDDFERKYKEALKSNEDRQKKLEEAERRVHQLQDSLNRMIYSMSGQFQELKMILRASSSTSASIPDDHEADVSSASSDNSSTNSEFTFPTPSLAPVNGSPFNPDALQLLVQDMSVTEISGSENCASIPEGGFDDFF